MRTRAFCISLVLAVAFACLATYQIGYARGRNAVVRAKTKFDLRSYSALYKFVQQGDTNRLNDRLRFLILIHYDQYERNFRNAPVDAEFSKLLAEAHVVADQERTNVVTLDTPAIIRLLNEQSETNRLPGSVSTNN